ncbi:hypothetical protein AB0J35_19485 [Nonomuraea angiospora]|uniref:hypothetical protein n=1 Tax=Nonomuraea angiospora TaxID=46172 RepID=UPI003437C06F
MNGTTQGRMMIVPGRAGGIGHRHPLKSTRQGIRRGHALDLARRKGTGHGHALDLARRKEIGYGNA